MQSEQGTTNTANTSEKEVKKEKMVCQKCGKKINITNSVKCNCGQTLCMKHRYQMEHDCSYDFKTVEKERLAAKNPLISYEKIIKI